MKIVRFELNAAAEKLFAEIQATDEFLETTPKLFFVKSMRAFMQSKAVAAEKLKAETAPKQPAHRETAEERKKREREEFDERKLEEYRSTGEWPRVRRNEKGSGHPEGSAFILDGCIMFTKPGDPDRLMGWEPPEDYPFMDDYREAQRELADRYTPPVDPNYPKQDDYDTDEEWAAAEVLYEDTVVSDALDAMPSARTLVPVSSTTLADELQALLDAGQTIA